MHCYDHPKSVQHCRFLLYLGFFGHARASGDMVGRCMPNSGREGCLGARVAFWGLMSALNFLIFDIFKYMGVYESIWKLLKVYEGI